MNLHFFAYVAGSQLTQAVSVLHNDVVACAASIATTQEARARGPLFQFPLRCKPTSEPGR